MGSFEPTPEQRRAMEDRGGSLLVSAAAGSGKTKVLVERVFAYLTEEHCHIDDFLIITFTRAAAAERRKRPAPGQQIGGNQCQHQRRCARLLTQNRHYHIDVL